MIQAKELIRLVTGYKQIICNKNDNFKLSAALQFFTVQQCLWFVVCMSVRVYCGVLCVSSKLSNKQ
jgi:hypothetical protein